MTSITGKEEATESYSSLLLMKTEAFKEFAKMSSVGPARSWFESVIISVNGMFGSWSVFHARRTKLLEGVDIKMTLIDMND
jgi:hypothetical protein